ncbi:MAG: NADAR family protein [Lachnospiraceae bacterium]|nr:NADAR family protein [Clostridiales bacterium]MBR6850828.1 NADAR family protein [Lachnospiraceae bacterium]
MDLIGFYREGEAFGCFSNWYPAEFDYAGKHYATSEQFMMYQKVLMFGQFDLAGQIMATPDPENCKIIGRTFFPEFDGALWKKTRYEVVKRGVRQKFAQNPDILQVLLETGDSLLAECSPSDADWGIKIGENDPAYKDVSKWQGENLLGRMLMELRAEFRTELAGHLGGVLLSRNGKNRSSGFPIGDSSEVDIPKIPYIDARNLAPIPEWESRAGELRRIPQFFNTIKAYAEVLGRGYGLASGVTPVGKGVFLFDKTLAGWEEALRAGNCGIPEAGFFELKQDVYDIAGKLSK